MKHHHSLTIRTGIAALIVSIPFAVSALSMSLDVGSQGSEVSELQTFLASDPAIYPEGLVTGYFGPLTQAAVERYQCRENIVCTGDATTTGYGRVGPMTMARINAALGFGTGGSADDAAPILSPETVTMPSSGTVSVVWSTNEDATSRVMYSTVVPFLYASAPSFADPTYDMVQSVTLTGLAPRTTYYYVRESIDPHGNLSWSLPRPFVTQ